MAVEKKFPMLDATGVRIATALEKISNGLTLYDLIDDGAGPHNMIFRGKELGATVTDEQYTAISNGTFKDLFIGDYWKIGEINWRIAAFDYWLHTGDAGHEVVKHHAVIVPDSGVGANQKMNDSATTDGAYYGSKMRQENMATAKATITGIFGAHLLTRREFWINACTGGKATGAVWDDACIELMTEEMVYGGTIMESKSHYGEFQWTHTTCKTQLPLFAFRPDLIVEAKRQYYWLQNVATAVYFCVVDGTGRARCDSATLACAVRPAFPIS